jgi:very-short-patch-repair endonuclease
MDPLKEIGMHAGASPNIFRKAEMLRSKMTIYETKIWRFLSKKPLGFKFRRQHPFGIYVLDFYCHSKRLSIEID